MEFAKGPMAIGLISLCCSCHYESISPNEKADYFPLEDKSQTNYLKEYGNMVADETSIWWSDTVTLTVSGDTVIDGLSYKIITTQFGWIEKVVRREGSRYFGRNHEMYGGFSWEYLFLDTSLPVGSTWEHIKNQGQTKTVYVVEEVNSTHVLNGVKYKDVIKLNVNYYDTYTEDESFEYRYSVVHYYANGIGEIYAYYPYPASGAYSDLKISILPNSK